MNNSFLLMSSGIIFLIVALALFAILLTVFIIVVPMKIYIRALVSGCHISMTRLVGMRMRKVDTKLIVNTYILAQKAGLSLTIQDLETHYMAGGNIEKLVNALIAAHSAKLNITVDEAKAIDLSGRDVNLAIETSVKPRVIKTDMISAVAKDGVELKVSARVTVKANLDKQIGGAGQDTILARVGEGIVTAVGAANTHKDILANPSVISKYILSKNLDANTAYRILSVDINDIDVGKNIGADLRIAEADAKKRISQASAEERKAQAVAHEQEMKAKTQEMRAVVLAAESEVHKAMANALKSGKLGVMDYYKMQNVIADTNMRNSFTNKDKPNRNGGGEF